MFWKWSKKKEQVYHVGNEDVAVPEVHTGKVAHEQAAQQDTGEKENTTKTWPSQRCISPTKRKSNTTKQNRRRAARTAFMPARRRFFCV